MIMPKRSLAACGVAVLLLVLASAADASSPVPAWGIESLSRPTNFAPGTDFGSREFVENESDYYQILVSNIGGAASNGEPIAITDTLPGGLTLASANARVISAGTLSPFPIGECTGAQTVTCTTEVTVSAGKSVLMEVPVDVASEAPASVTNIVSVGGGGAPSVSASENTRLSSAAAGFGLQDSEVTATNVDGSPDLQAGSHPFALTTSLDFNTRLSSEGGLVTSGDLKDIELALPPGLVGDTTAIPQCGQTVFDLSEQKGAEACPDTTEVGLANIVVDALGGHPTLQQAGVYNLTPRPGVPAELGFNLLGLVVHLTPRVRPNDDGLTVSSVNTSQAVHVYGFRITIWGVPYASGHDATRGTCNVSEEAEASCPVDAPPVSFLTMPTSCNGPFSYGLHLDSWQSPETFIGSPEPIISRDADGVPAGLDGCNQLEFEPSTAIAPETTDADTPSGLTAEVKVPQEGLTSAEGLAAADIKNTTVTLPEGVAINPGQAAGLAACQPSEDAVGTEALPSCPAASKVGTVEIATPLLRDELRGDVYVLQSNPPNLQLLVAASADGVNVKLIGDVHLNEQTGQLTTTFTETPQLPFTDFKLSFSGGPQAALATPTTCGLFESETDFTPWTAPLENDAFSTSSFAIYNPPEGASSCTSPLPFAPVLTAGATTDQAGGYTDFSLLLQRTDGQQRISTLSFKTPDGLLGMISKIPLCEEPQAAQGTCSPASQIGHTVVEAGPGPYPLVVPQPGQPPAPIYLTGGYDGAPYGLSVVVPLVVGPFVLETQVVRAKIEVDPHTAQLTITTNPLPSIIDGIPTDLRTINAVIDREAFMFNPTNCSPQSFSGTAKSTEDATAPISSHFQVGSCQSLKFAPNFTVATQAKTSKKDGASLEAKIVYPKGALGANQASSQSNIAAVKVDLPKQLPSRLTTLQKACLAKVFEADPAACPKESMVGHATAVTPVLPVPLNGPAYFVSHGGEAFPSLIIVLQGYGVTVDLVGTTFIHGGVTSSTFQQVPDVPINSFDLVLPEGPFSALASNLPAKAKDSFCGQMLAMPTAFRGQNGAEIHESTSIAVTGCPKVKAKKVRKRHKAKKGHKAKGSAKRVRRVS